MTKHRHYDSHDTGPEWGTPPHIWKPLGEALGGFDLDPASGAESEPIADERLTVQDDGLDSDWFGDVWLNPPYGRSHNPKWAKKASNEASRDEVDTITALIPGTTDTQYFQNNYANADYITFIEGRVSFDGAGENKASFSSVIASWGDFPDKYLDELKDQGFVTERV